MWGQRIPQVECHETPILKLEREMFIANLCVYRFV